MQKFTSLAILIFISITLTSYSQTPAILNSTIPYDSNLSMSGNQDGYLNVNDIQTAFNHARRMEEAQFCLPANSISNLLMPNQNTWNNMNSDERLLFLSNAERMSRAGLNYCQGDGAVGGLPFTGIESNIDNIAQAHATQLINTQSTTSISQAANIDANQNIGGSGCTTEKFQLSNCCHTFVPYSVYRIFFTNDDTPANPSTITTPGLEVRAVYFCIYGNGSVGNGRKMLLLQNIESGGTPANPCGFNNDYGDPRDEGFIGFGLRGGVPHPSLNRSHIDMLVISYFDPVPQAFGCNYNCTTCDPCVTNIVQNSNVVATDFYQASNSIRSSATVPNSNDVNMQANSFIELRSSFEVKSGGTYEAVIDGCYFSLN